jgi:hypothetical protein
MTDPWASTRRCSPVRRIGRVLAWPAWAVGQVVSVVLGGTIIDETPKRQRLDRAQRKAWRARLAPWVLSGHQRERQADFFDFLPTRATAGLFLPDGLLEAHGTGVRWSPLKGGRIRELATRWDDVRVVSTQPLGGGHALTFELGDGSTVGVITDEDPRHMPEVCRRIEPAHPTLA